MVARYDFFEKCGIERAAWSFQSLAFPFFRGTLPATRGRGSRDPRAQVTRPAGAGRATRGRGSLRISDIRTGISDIRTGISDIRTGISDSGEQLWLQKRASRERERGRLIPSAGKQGPMCCCRLRRKPVPRYKKVCLLQSCLRQSGRWSCHRRCAGAWLWR